MTADPAESLMLLEQAPGAGRAEMPPMHRGLSLAAAEEKEEAATTTPTIPPEKAAGRGRAALRQPYMKPRLAPPLPACDSSPAARREGQVLGSFHARAFSPATVLNLTPASEAGIRDPTADG